MNGLLRKIFIFGLVMAAIAAGGWFGRKAYKRITERRMLVKARSYMEKKDWASAGMCLQRALQLNPLSAAASDATADLLETQGVPAALNWRIRASQLRETSSHVCA